MSPELIAIIIIVGVSLAAIIIPGQREMRRDIAELRERMARLEIHLTERMAKLEGLFEGFTKREKPA